MYEIVSACVGIHTALNRKVHHLWAEVHLAAYMIKRWCKQYSKHVNHNILYISICKISKMIIVFSKCRTFFRRQREKKLKKQDTAQFNVHYCLIALNLLNLLLVLIMLPLTMYNVLV